MKNTVRTVKTEIIARGLYDSGIDIRYTPLLHPRLQHTHWRERRRPCAVRHIPVPATGLVACGA
jgi:hypothetical protein